MKIENLEVLVRQGETACLEFKTTLSDSRKIIETIAAMATIGGGTILVGVKPDGTAAGVAPGEGELERLVQQVLAGTDPRVFVDLDFAQLGGRRVLRVRVPPGDGPHLAFGRAFYRSGPATIAMTRDEYERRLLDRLRESSGFERRTDGGVAVAEADGQAIARFADAARGRGLAVGAAGSAEVLARLNLCRGDLLTHGGVLLFGRDPQRTLPQATIRAIARRGGAEDARAFEGRLFDQIEETFAFVLRNLKTQTVRENVRRSEAWELPAAAIREVVANAVVHRDYRSTAPIQLRLDDRQLSIWNPGHFPPPITAEMLRRDHPSVPVNPFIARAAYLAGYIEEWGTGTLRVVEAMQANGNGSPLFTEEDHAGVRVVLPLRGAIPEGLAPRQMSFLRTQTADASFTTGDYAAASGVSLRTGQNDLSALEAMGLVRREGRGRLSRWVRMVAG